MLSIDSCIAGKKDLPWRIIEGEALMVDVDQGEIIYLNEVGAEIWRIINEDKTEKKPVRDIINHVCAQFEVAEPTAEADVLEFLNQLAKKGVVSD